MMRVLVVFGTRPEAIKCFPVIRELKKYSGVEVVTCSTGQHRSILDQVVNLTGFKPDMDLQLMRKSPKLSEIVSDVLQAMERVVADVQPDRILVQGDTTTTMAASLAAFHNGVPLAHIEAGLRTNDLMSPWPEEANRRIVTVVADMHFAPTNTARDNLLVEHVKPKNIFVTGNTVIDALHYVKKRIEQRKVSIQPLPQEVELALGTGKKLILLTAHRRENWGGGIERICRSARKIASRGDVHILLPVHPNPNVKMTVHEMLSDRAGISLVEPLDYATLLAALNDSFLVLTDSGGLQEEAPALGKPVLILRNTTERPEGVVAGGAKIVGTDVEKITKWTNVLLDNPDAYTKMSKVKNPFGDGNAARRIAEALIARNTSVRLERMKEAEVVV